MTQYLLSVHGNTDVVMDPDADHSAVFAAVDRFNTKLQAEAAWVFAGGLMPIDSATTVDGTGETPIVTDGPFVESTVYLGGFWIIESDDLDAALAWATQGSAACQSPVEVRPLQSV